MKFVRLISAYNTDRDIVTLCLCLYCISMTKKSDTPITVIYHTMSLSVLYQYDQEEWYTYHSDLSLYVSVCIVSVWLRRVIHLSQWFITLCLCLYISYMYAMVHFCLFNCLRWELVACYVDISETVSQSLFKTFFS
jgi:hypothetical protein